eukprot:767809-Ditylum_brightwellii.AAC.1
MTTGPIATSTQTRDASIKARKNLMPSLARALGKLKRKQATRFTIKKRQMALTCLMSYQFLAATTVMTTGPPRKEVTMQMTTSMGSMKM